MAGETGAEAGSPAIDTGVSVTDNGGVDYTGATVYNRLPNIGAFENQTGTAHHLGTSTEQPGEQPKRRM